MRRHASHLGSAEGGERRGSRGATGSVEPTHRTKEGKGRIWTTEAASTRFTHVNGTFAKAEPAGAAALASEGGLSDIFTEVKENLESMHT